MVVDKGWHSYWQRRFENVLDDAETLQTDGDGNILSIGQRPADLSEIEAQYIGLMAFRGPGIEALREVYARAQQQARPATGDPKRALQIGPLDAQKGHQQQGQKVVRSP